GCGSLNPRTIEQCVSSNLWLKEGIQVSGSFYKAQKIIKTCTEFSEKKRSNLLICCDFILLLI
ncbi:hypothetical protein VP01_8907g1, partial [Puccinia sorghi]